MGMLSWLFLITSIIISIVGILILRSDNMQEHNSIKK